MFKCERCGNENPKYIGYKNGKPYCRFCIGFKGETVEEYKPRSGAVVLDLKYSLSEQQKEISKQVKKKLFEWCRYTN